MAKLGKSIADMAPPPDKLKRAMPEPDADEAGGASDQDEDDAAELSAMEEFDKADNSSDRLAALKNLLAICKPEY